MAKTKIFVAKEISIEEAKGLFGEEFEKEYEDMLYSIKLGCIEVGNHVITNSGLVLLAVEE